MKMELKKRALIAGIAALFVLPAISLSGQLGEFAHNGPDGSGGFLIAGSGSLLVTGSQPPVAPQEPPSETPELVVAETQFEFGRVLDGAEVVHDFLIENRGRGDLAIEQVLTG